MWFNIRSTTESVMSSNAMPVANSWFTLKDTGKKPVFNALPLFQILKTLNTGPITNHVNFVHTAWLASLT
jgi:hypothetical protein